MLIGALQICSVLDWKQNLDKIESHLKEAEELGVEILFLPECFLSMSDGDGLTRHLLKEDDDRLEILANLARKYSLFLLGGSAATESAEPNRAYNRVYNFSPQGELLGTYNKINLFKCSISDELTLDETESYLAGDSLSALEIGPWKIGFSVCFDLRFPELYREYGGYGVNLISISSAFTSRTGRDHWETLVRARAIENQSYVVAANQWGEHNSKMCSWGHSMIVDPWGKVLVNAKEGEKLVTAEIDRSFVDNVRSRMNVLITK